MFHCGMILKAEDRTFHKCIAFCIDRNRESLFSLVSFSAESLLNAGTALPKSNLIGRNSNP